MGPGARKRSILSSVKQRAYSSAWLERFPDKEEVDGSSPSRPTQVLKGVRDEENKKVSFSITCSCWFRWLQASEGEQGGTGLVDSGDF